LFVSFIFSTSLRFRLVLSPIPATAYTSQTVVLFPYSPAYTPMAPELPIVELIQFASASNHRVVDPFLIPATRNITQGYE
jgi:hypothetical protein